MPSKDLEKRTLVESELFDSDWYLERNSDVGMLGMDPLEHFLWLGARLNRSPGPNFDSEQYLRTYGDVARQNYNPVLHYIRYGRTEGRQAFKVPGVPAAPASSARALRRVAGGLAVRPGRPVVLLCSHVAGEKLFGGERSLLDMIDGLNALEFNVVVTIPAAGNSAYFETLRARSMATYVLPYGWWRDGVAVDDAVVAKFARIIADEGVQVVHANTIVLREPLIAAQRMGVRSIVHVRELIRHDEALLKMIGEPADEIVAQVWGACDQLIANSKATLESFAQLGRKAALVYNTVQTV